ncbi:hypothetical protein [Mycobacterium palustre]|uniref:Uncharacterized protein n=1 Tax=Mycobacterium palustre TaxID=153971 RepID=A0A1X1ZXR5_9MYCO|nr:hypothetical protein [Mycobacterium palustre]MCV7104116.1 hypothetical protein [Mycobacterium palustre]ORW30241.1 hypothetical protein AWC19_25645 [Mycobacterium palustre]
MLQDFGVEPADQLEIVGSSTSSHYSKCQQLRGKLAVAGLLDVRPESGTVDEGGSDCNVCNSHLETPRVNRSWVATRSIINVRGVTLR